MTTTQPTLGPHLTRAQASAIASAADRPWTAVHVWLKALAGVRAASTLITNLSEALDAYEDAGDIDAGPVRDTLRHLAGTLAEAVAILAARQPAPVVSAEQVEAFADRIEKAGRVYGYSVAADLRDLLGIEVPRG